MTVSRWIGEYEIVRRLRVGGMATLYLAKRHGAAGFSRLVALKVIHPHLLDQPKFIEMFVDEARICAQISHPNVVHVEEFGEVDGLQYLVMEYIDGCSVNELLQFAKETETPIAPSIAASIVMQVARGLHAAHEAVDADGHPLDVIHRDITPSNVLLSTAGHVKVIDFGIAKAKNRIAETEAGFALKGKYRYVAPEQATRGDIDRRTDIFSLGVVFWELLTGQQLFDDDTHIGLFNRLQETTVQAPSQVNPAVPEDLDPIVAGMLQHAPADRPPTAQDVQRWIAAVMPSAVSLDADQLGSLVKRVKERRSAGRAPSEDHVGSDPSFSNAPRRSRSFTTQAPEDYRIEVIPPAEPPTVTEPPKPASQVAPPPAPAPAARSRASKLVPLALGGVLVAGVLIGMKLSRQDARPTASSATSTSSTPPAAVQMPVTPPPAPAAVEVAAPAPTSATAVAPPTPAVEPPPPATAPARTPATPVRAAATKRRPAPARVSTKTVESVPLPAPTAPAKSSGKIRAGTSTFVGGAFDDDGNTSATSAKPSTTKVKSTTIVTDFGN